MTSCMGFTGDRGSLTAGVEYSKEDPVWARDRWFCEDRFPTGEKTAPRPGWPVGHQPVRHPDRRRRPPLATLIRDGQDRDAARLRQLPSYQRHRRQQPEPGLDRVLAASSAVRCSSTAATTSPTTSVSTPTCCTPIAIRSHRTPAIRTSRPRSAPRCRPTATTTRWAAGTTPTARRMSTSSVAAGTCRVQVHNSLTTFRFTGALSGSFEIGEQLLGLGCRLSVQPERRQADQHRQPQHRRRAQRGGSVVPQ